MKKVFPFLVCVLLLGISCSKQSIELNDEQKATIISELEEQSRGVISAGRELNAQEFLGYFSEDKFISVNSGVNYFASRNAWADSVAYWYSFIESRSYESTEIRVTPLTVNLALTTGSIKGEALMKSGEKINLNVLITNIWKKETSGWKIINAHESWKDIIEE